jgi:hypothetical protein
MGHSDTKHTLTLLWIIFAVVILGSLAFTVEAFSKSDDFYENLSRKERVHAKAMEKKYLRHGDVAIRFKGDAKIKEDEFIKGDVIILKGVLQVNGEIDGTILAIFGDVDLEDDALVHGDVIAIDGNVWRDGDAEIKGDIVETDNRANRNRKVTYKGKSKNKSYIKKTSKKKGVNCNNFDDDESAWVNYNRVDGLTLGLKFPSQGWWMDRDHNFALSGKAGYSFASKNPQFQLGFERWFFGDYKLVIGAETHDLTDTQDRWIINDIENSLAAAFLKEDFQDFYNKKGYSIFLCQNLGRLLNIRAEYHEDQFENLENHAKWSLFGKNKKFHPNPSALPFGFVNSPAYELTPHMQIKSVAAKLTIDSRNDKKNTTNGWYITAFAERAGHELDSPLDFERFILDIRRYQPLGWDENLNIRLRAGTATGTLPPMYWYDLGGISTMRGYGYKEMTGDRMVLGNLEYRLKTSRADWFILDSFDIIIFGDAGLAWFANEDLPNQFNTWPLDEDFVDHANNTYPKDSFDKLTFDNVKSDIGIALASHDDNFRINFAKRMDRDFGEDDFVVTFRISQPF